ncbi:hypothetical protein TNCV_3160881 [Trichonephila clavipes]|nr:hypothetical protein TNCV_3160881 [Trichonephila clavipes]
MVHDGISVHFCTPVRNWLDMAYLGHWIGNMGLVLWSSWSPDLGLLDIFIYCTSQGIVSRCSDNTNGRIFVEWAQNEIAVVPDFHKRILFSDEAHFWLNGYVNKQNCRIWSEANPQVYVETPLHPKKLIVWCTLWVGGILLQKR